MKSMSKRHFPFNINDAQSATHRIVVLGDPHLLYKTVHSPGPEQQARLLAAKIKVRDDINNWEDVSLVAMVGDVVASTGLETEYESVGNYFSRFSKPISPIIGNHDFVYADLRNEAGGLVLGDSTARRSKLNRFRETFELQNLSYTKEIGSYLLVFLSLEMEQPSSFMCQYSLEQLSWLRGVLEKSSDKPTLIFAHAPLKDTLTSYNRNANTPDFYAQPATGIHHLLAEFPQIFLWVSGHTHTPAINPEYHAAINCYDGRVWNIHNADMDREIIWTNSLYLYPDRVVVRTFNHHTDQWEAGLERTITIPDKSHESKALIHHHRELFEKWMDAAKEMRKKIELPVPLCEKVDTDNFDYTSGCWENAAVIDDFRLRNNFEEKASVPTTVKVLHDSQNLYLAFDCQMEAAERMENLKAVQPKAKDVWPDRPWCEIFLDGDQRDVEGYYHLAFNAIGGQYDALGYDKKYDNEKWSVTAKRSNESWKAIVVIPLESFGIDIHTGNRIGITLFRNTGNSTWRGASVHQPAGFNDLVLQNEYKKESE